MRRIKNILTVKKTQKLRDEYRDDLYPLKIYNKLVLSKLKVTNKFSILGAWKTGNIRKESKKGYYEFFFENEKYYLTKRWFINAFSKREAWKEIDKKNVYEIYDKSMQNNESVDDLFDELKTINGIGNTYATFILHCIDPDNYPIFDQHVWRACCFLENNLVSNIKPFQNGYCNYHIYCEWFKKLKIVYSDTFSSKDLDSALWVLGKKIKSYTKKKHYNCDDILNLI